MKKLCFCVVFLVWGTGSSWAEGVGPKIERIEGARLGGKPVEGLTLRGADIPKYHVVDNWLATALTYHQEDPLIYRLRLEKAGIELDTPAETAILRAMADPLFDSHGKHLPVLDRNDPGAKEEYRRRGIDKAIRLGHLYRQLLHQLDRAGHDAAAFDRYMETEGREGMSMTFLSPTDPFEELGAESEAYERALEGSGQ